MLPEKVPERRFQSSRAGKTYWGSTTWFSIIDKIKLLVMIFFLEHAFKTIDCILIFLKKEINVVHDKRKSSNTDICKIKRGNRPPLSPTRANVFYNTYSIMCFWSGG